MRATTSGRQPRTSAAPRGSQRRTAISLCGWMCGDVDDPRRVRLDERGQLVDVDVRARAGVQDPAGRRVGHQRVGDEPGAVLDVEEVARLGPIAVDAELLAEQASAG